MGFMRGWKHLSLLRVPPVTLSIWGATASTKKIMEKKTREKKAPEAPTNLGILGGHRLRGMARLHALPRMALTSNLQFLNPVVLGALQAC